MELLCLDAAALERALPMTDAIASARTAYRALASGTALVPARGFMSAPRPAGTTIVMGAAVEGAGLASKVVTVNPENPPRGLPGTVGLVVVLDPETGMPAALCDGTWLTAWRTGAATGAATDLLARPDARSAVVFGAGTQARTQVLALDAARPFERIAVHARRRETAEALVADLDVRTQAELVVSDDAETSVRGADVIACATSAHDPVVFGDWLTEGVHISGVGSFRPSMAEVDAEAVRRARVFVDTVAGALEEAGDLVQAEAAGVTHRDAWIPIGEVLIGTTPGRTADDEITFFKSVGNATQDVTAASIALSRAREQGLGTMVRM